MPQSTLAQAANVVHPDRSETLGVEIEALNATSALYTAEFSRRRADGSEIGRLQVT